MKMLVFAMQFSRGVCRHRWPASACTRVSPGGRSRGRKGGPAAPTRPWNGGAGWPDQRV